MWLAFCHLHFVCVWDPGLDNGELLKVATALMQWLATSLPGGYTVH